MSPLGPSFSPQLVVYSRNQQLPSSSAPRSANISPILSSLRILPVASGLSPLTARHPLSSTPFLPIIYIQTPYFHAITHSFAQRRAAIPLILKGFRTLSIATGVCTLPPRSVKPSSFPTLGRSDLQPTLLLTISLRQARVFEPPEPIRYRFSHACTARLLRHASLPATIVRTHRIALRALPVSQLGWK